MSSIWEQEATSKGADGEAYEIPPAGLHPAVLVALIDLGTHREEYQGKQEEYRKVFLAFELVNARMTGIARNHTIGIDCRISGHEKSKLRKLMESWRGSKYKEGEKFDLGKAIGRAATVAVQHNTNKDGSKTYAKLESVHKPSGAVGNATLPIVTYEMGKGPLPSHDWLPYIYGRTVEEVIKDSLEMRGQTPAGQQQQQPAPQQQYQAPPASAPTPADEIPF